MDAERPAPTPGSVPPRPEHRRAGSWVLDEFQLRRELLATTEEELWVGRERSSRRPVLVRIARSVAAVERARRAEEALRRIHDRFPDGVPGVIGFVAGGATDDGHALVVEHVEGASLTKVLWWTRFTPPRAVAAVRELCEAVAACHEAGVIVEDLHPDHILVGLDDRGRERVWISGFERAPTPVTSAPELLRLEGSTERSDVYGLGLVLYRLLAGRFPFEGHDDVVIALQLAADPPSPGQFAPRLRVPRGLEEVLARCLAKDPDDRFASVRELARTLEPLGTVPQRDWIPATGSEATLVTEHEEEHHDHPEGRPSPVWLLVPLILLLVVAWLILG